MSERNSDHGRRVSPLSSSAGGFMTKAAFLAMVGAGGFAKDVEAAVPSVGSGTEVANVNTSDAHQRNMVDLGGGKYVYLEETESLYDTKPMFIDTTATSPTTSEVCGSGSFGDSIFEVVSSLDLASSGTLYANVYADWYGNNHRELTDTSSGGDFSSCSESLIAGLDDNTEKSYDYTTGSEDLTEWNGSDTDIVLDDGTIIGSTDSEGSPGRCHGTDVVFYHVWNSSTDVEIWVTDGTTSSFVMDGAYPRCNGSTLHYSEHDGTSWNLYGATITWPAEDGDSDGYASDVDCDDTDAAINPGATEVCDGEDNDCDGTTDVGASDTVTAYTDEDGDGYGVDSSATEVCELSGNQVDRGGDCDDTNGSAHDYTTGYDDVDGDGFGDPDTEDEYCPVPSDKALNGDDCDDNDASKTEGDSCAGEAEGPSEGTFSAGTEVVLASGSTLTVDTGSVSIETVDGEHVLTVQEGASVWLSATIPTVAQMAEASGNDAEVYVYSDSYVNFVGGIFNDGAEQNAGGSTTINLAGTRDSNGEMEGEEPGAYDTGFLNAGPTNNETHDAESSEEDLNVCYEEGGVWYQESLVDGPEESSYLCVTLHDGAADGRSKSGEIQTFPLSRDQLVELFDGYTCEASTVDSGTPEKPAENNPNNPTEDPQGCSVTHSTPTGGLAVIGGYLALAAGALRRRRQ